MKHIGQKFRRVKSKSFFYKYFRSYSIILAVPLITVALLFSQAQKLVKEQIQIASHNTLNQFFERIDDIVKSSYDISVTIASNDKCLNYPRYAKQKPDKTTYEVWEIFNFLKAYAEERYFDVLVYYPIDDRVISGKKASAKLDAYCDTFFANVFRENVDSLKEEFRSIVGNAPRKPTLYSMGGKGADSYLCMAMKQLNSRNEENSFTIVLLFEQAYISTILKSVEDSKLNGRFLIHNGAREAIFSTDRELLSYELEGYERTSNSFEQMIEKNAYVLQIRESEVVEAYYTYAVSRDYYWKKLFRLYIICGIGMLVSLAIGILTAREEAKRVYRPLELLVETLKKMGKSDYDDRTKSEFEYIESMFQKEVDEKIIMNNALRKGKEMKRENFIYSLLNGNHEIVTEDTNNIFSANGIELCSDYFAVVILHIGQPGNAGADLEHFVISDVFCELINEENQGYVVLLPAGKYAILVNAKKEMTNERLIALLREGKDFLKQYYEMSMTIGISSIQEGMEGVHKAYEEACLAIRYKYLLGKESIIHYCQVSDRTFEYAPTSESKLLFEISNYLSEESTEKNAEQIVEEIMQNYRINPQASMETIECFKFETISVLNRVVMQGGFGADQWKIMVQELLGSETLHEFAQSFTVILTKVYKKQQEQEAERDVCVRAFEYIEANYMQQQLSLAFLGELFRITPSYLSKLFKEKYQISIPEFITRSRINGAKQQLRNTQNNIGKIAEDNGFLSSSVFVKTFKKLEGITPGIYREFFKKENE